MTDQDGPSRGNSLRNSPRTIVVMVVVAVVLVLLFSTLFSYTLWLPDDEELPPETIEDGVTIINGDVVWEGRSGVLERRVEVRPGGSLRINDSDLRIPIEDLAASYKSWFNVQGELTIENTNIGIWVDPLLERALAYEVHPGTYPAASWPPFTYRAINLKGAVEPVLDIDTRVWGKGGELVVAYQTDPGASLQILAELKLEFDPQDLWQHHQVDLSTIKGSIVNLFIIGHDPDLGRYLLGNLRVTDGGGDLPGDVHFTGFPDRDHWGHLHSNEVLGSLRYNPWGDLIWCSGTLCIRDSNLTCPRSIDHIYSSPINSDIKFNPYDPDKTPVLYYKMKDGGDISTHQADVTIERTELEHILLRAHDSDILVRDVDVTGDRELMTAYHCSGTVEGTTFLGQADSSDTTSRWYGNSGPRFWGLAVWYQRDGGVMNVTDCTFIDTPLGLDLTHTAAAVEGCTFINNSFMSIWDHNSTGLDDWEKLNASCDFSMTHRMWYYQSHNGRFDITSPQVPSNWSDGDYYTGGSIEGSDGGPTLYCEDLWVYSISGRLYVPTFSVSGKGVAGPINEVYVKINSNWGGGTLATLDTGLSHFDIELLGSGTNPPPPSPRRVYLEIIDEAINGTGAVDLQLEATFIFGNDRSMEHMAPQDLVVLERIDGELVRTHSLEDHQGGSNFIQHTFNTYMDVRPGASRLEFVLEGIPWGSDDVLELARCNRSYLRPSDPEDLVPLLEPFTVDYPVVLIDEGLDIELDVSDISLEWGGYNVSSLTLFMGEGSSISLTDVNDLDIAELYLESEGPGDITIRDIDVIYSTCLRLTNTSLTVEDSHLGGIDGTFQKSNCQFKNVTIGPYMWSWAVECNITFEDSDIMVDDSLLVPYYSNLSIINCTVRGEGDHHWYLDSNVNDTIVFYGCTFDGTRLDLGSTAYAHTLIEFSDCVFRNGSTLEAPRHSVQYYLDQQLPDDPSFTVVNTSFIGEGSGFIGHTNMFRAAVEGMESSDGASYQVYIDTRVIVPTRTVEGYQYRAELTPIAAEELVDWEANWEDELLHIRSLYVMDSVDDPDGKVVIEVAITGEDISYGDDPIVWFYSIDLTAPSITISLPDWGDLVDLINDLMQEMGGYQWWSGD